MHVRKRNQPTKKKKIGRTLVKVGGIRIRVADIYNSNFIMLHARKMTAKRRHDADEWFDEVMIHLEGFRKNKAHEKRALFQHFWQAATVALYLHQPIGYSRDCPNRKILTGLIDLCEEAGLVVNMKSPPGSPKMSRLIPTDKMKNMIDADDPKKFDPPNEKDRRLVYLHRREKPKDEIKFDPKHPVATEYQEKLEKINDVNDTFEIRCQEWNEWKRTREEPRLLRPTLFAQFTNNFTLHGRIYTEGNYGHQGLSKEERETITFNFEPSVELDYSGLHPRMLYHLKGIKYTRDPYRLWSDDTTDPMRVMAKVAVNALINAASPESAVSACNNAMKHTTKEGERKTGKALRDARHIFDASMKTKLKFADIVPLAMERHPKIKSGFGNDMGIRLMRKDSQLAVNVLDYFADLHVPCLPVHDSFIVPVRIKEELRRIMMQVYHEEFGFLPVIK